MFRRVAIYILVLFLILIVSFALSESIIIFWYFKDGSAYQILYEALVNPTRQPTWKAQPYLNYINHPMLKNSQGVRVINQLGLRYPKDVSVVKPDSTFRILFIGGSTTVGDLEYPFEMFPSIVEKKIKDSLVFINSNFNKIECLNAGVQGLCSAEILTHYLFKYQYLEPDLIVVHTGVKDVFAYAKINQADYQPDYHNWRRSFKDYRPLSSWKRKLIQSKLFAFIYFRTVFKEYLGTELESNVFCRFTNEHNWFDIGSDSIPKRYNAFYQNIQHFILIAKHKGHKVLLFPDIIDTSRMPPPYNEKMKHWVNLHKSYLIDLATIHQVDILTLQSQDFPSKLFESYDNDGIHVNAEGEKVKALYLEPVIKKIIASTCKTKNL